jgi:hypothetical protein
MLTRTALGGIWQDAPLTVRSTPTRRLLALGLLALFGCGAPQRSPDPTPPLASTAPVASLENEKTPAPTPVPRVESQPKQTPEVAPVPSSAHPVVEAFVQLASAFDPKLKQSLTTLDLSGTAGADTARTLAFLEYRLRLRLAIRALERSHDRVLRSLTAELTRIPAFIETPTAHINLKMGPVEPAACEGCEPDAEEGICKTPACVRANAALLPAVLSAAWFGATLEFGGHPSATNEGVEYGDDMSLDEYLDALVAAGLSREEISSALELTIKELISRSRFVESTAAVVPRAGEPLMWATLRTGFERWRSAYAPELAAKEPPSPKALDENGFALQQGFALAEPTLYRRFTWGRIQSQINARTREHKRYLKYELDVQRGKEVSYEDPTNEYDTEACLPGPPAKARACDETEAAATLFADLQGEASSLAENPEGATKLAQSVARAFELLTLSGSSPVEISKFVETLAKSAVWAP